MGDGHEINAVPTHRPGAGLKALDRSPGAFNRSRFYRSREWRAVRAVHLVREPYCVQCLAGGRAVAGSAVHHVETVEAAPGRKLDPTNLRTLCRECHSALHKRAAPAGGAGPAVDA